MLVCLESGISNLDCNGLKCWYKLSRIACCHRWCHVHLAVGVGAAADANSMRRVERWEEAPAEFGVIGWMLAGPTRLAGLGFRERRFLPVSTEPRLPPTVRCGVAYACCNQSNQTAFQPGQDACCYPIPFKDSLHRLSQASRGLEISEAPLTGVTSNGRFLIEFYLAEQEAEPNGHIILFFCQSEILVLICVQNARRACWSTHKSQLA